MSLKADYAAALLTGLIVSLVAVPLALRLAMRRGLLDTPEGRHTHTTAVPRIGGVGILIGFLAGLLAAALMQADYAWWNRESTGILLGALTIFAAGLADDVLRARGGVSPWLRLLLQVLAAGIAMGAGVRIRGFQIPGDGYLHFPHAVSLLVTLLWIVGITNALNFIDGLDGYVGGVSLIMAGTIALIAMYGPKSSPATAIFALAMLGGICGFLRLNFPPAKIFMGDGGAYLLGFLLATLAISGVMKGATIIAVCAPMVILALPILNLAGVVVVRVLRGDNPMAADRTHLHHRLQDSGWNDLSALLFVYAICGLCGSAALSLIELSQASAALAGGVALLLVVVAARRARPEPADGG